jgi:glucosamine--fructose-6-phosphate aminotransferase (isomerizing)
VVHNGIIENYQALKQGLQAAGHQFHSETDTEVLAHLIEDCWDGSLEEAVRAALRRVEGSYAVGVVDEREPEKVVGARQGSPLVVGVGSGEYFLASDVPALLPFTKEEIILDDGEMVVLTSSGAEVRDIRRGRSFRKPTVTIPWDPVQAEKMGYRHFMLKEIHEQPQALRAACLSRIRTGEEAVALGKEGLREEDLQGVRKISLVACGTSYHAALAGKYLLEPWLDIPVEVDIASEFRYRSSHLSNTLLVVISQSGETADTLAAAKEAKYRGAYVLAVCNVVGSSLSRLAHKVLYTHAGPEIGVASTKAFTTQVAVLTLLSVYLGRLLGGMPLDTAREILTGLKCLPDLVSVLLKQEEQIREIAKLHQGRGNALYLGRGLLYPVALEGALKLKEISYIHAEGYAAGEMKHGPIALIDREMPVVVLVPPGALREKVMGNMEEVKARDGIVIALAPEGDAQVREKADHVVRIPEGSPWVLPVLYTVPLQLLAYHIAVLKGCDVDQPRNLAKSVTVE